MAVQWKDSALLLPGAQAGSLVRALRPRKPYSQNRKINVITNILWQLTPAAVSERMIPGRGLCTHVAPRSILHWGCRHRRFSYLNGTPTVSVPPAWSPDSFYISYRLGLELARTSTPHFLCPRQNQTAPISSHSNFPEQAHSWGTPVPSTGGWKLLQRVWAWPGGPLCLGFHP